ncbi:hemolysin III family protein [Aliivibrio sp. S4TY2]|uniref:PAQR family membrane homeostasis protein TrhA n=1 Tax=unclassified Aliivibrio TaxID=2645654 RepID=UPI00237923C3|nr:MULTISPECIES: hemolysin III family protein [unclassified Aliivibrio]MDD9156178.1 hemolysin III family protein [Aliivibrio sp. S4TY2]MDD9159887.1 hemolysin III family protein [Aliivibrio sp. S4TY1]MDD9163886.1 hemolysin III family protein [Aliivibrio sp. S4MY2]MDD9167887.1 hemolysin III family protein [Aliivibrio sp. S4MY4]MDD9186923.1 hemolysin III family protein [Aliivibrio sp. S4MY3]
MSTSATYSKKEELANSLSHALGMVFGVVALILLLVKANAADADWLTIASMSVYGASIILLFLASTLYHSIAAPKAKRLLKTLDHCAIFLLIAGSYTPYLLVSLRTPLAYWLMGVIWAIALIGIIGKIVFVYRFKKLSLITYLIMGWLSVIAVYQLVIHIDINGVILLGLGGVIYSLGVIFYVAKKIPYNHAIWHLFVLGGCITQFLSIYYYVKPV